MKVEGQDVPAQLYDSEQVGEIEVENLHGEKVEHTSLPSPTPTHLLPPPPPKQYDDSDVAHRANWKESPTSQTLKDYRDSSELCETAEEGAENEEGNDEAGEPIVTVPEVSGHTSPHFRRKRYRGPFQWSLLTFPLRSPNIAISANKDGDVDAVKERDVDDEEESVIDDDEILPPPTLSTPPQISDSSPSSVSSRNWRAIASMRRWGSESSNRSGGSSNSSGRFVDRGFFLPRSSSLRSWTTTNGSQKSLLSTVTEPLPVMESLKSATLGTTKRPVVHGILVEELLKRPNLPSLTFPNRPMYYRGNEITDDEHRKSISLQYSSSSLSPSNLSEAVPVSSSPEEGGNNNLDCTQQSPENGREVQEENSISPHPPSLFYDMASTSYCTINLTEEDVAAAAAAAKHIRYTDQKRFYFMLVVFVIGIFVLATTFVVRSGLLGTGIASSPNVHLPYTDFPSISYDPSASPSTLPSIVPTTWVPGNLSTHRRKDFNGYSYVDGCLFDVTSKATTTKSFVLTSMDVLLDGSNDQGSPVKEYPVEVWSLSRNLLRNRWTHVVTVYVNGQGPQRYSHLKSKFFTGFGTTRLIFRPGRTVTFYVTVANTEKRMIAYNSQQRRPSVTTTNMTASLPSWEEPPRRANRDLEIIGGPCVDYPFDGVNIGEGVRGGDGVVRSNDALGESNATGKTNSNPMMWLGAIQYEPVDILSFIP